MEFAEEASFGLEFIGRLYHVDPGTILVFGGTISKALPFIARVQRVYVNKKNPFVIIPPYYKRIFVKEFWDHWGLQDIDYGGKERDLASMILIWFEMKAGNIR